jgi:hypothetical protein
MTRLTWFEWHALSVFMIKNDKWPNYQEADYSMCMMSFDLRN